MRYDRLFEIIRKLSLVTYQLWLPASYGLYPILNITHLEEYKLLPPSLGDRSTRHLNHQDFNKLPEFEAEEIVSEQLCRIKKGQCIQEYKVLNLDYVICHLSSA